MAAWKASGSGKKKKRTLEQVMLEDNFRITGPGTGRNAMRISAELSRYAPIVLGRENIVNNAAYDPRSAWFDPMAGGGQRPISLGDPFGSKANNNTVVNRITEEQGDAIAGTAMAGCAAITNPSLRAACVAAVSIGQTFIPRSGGSENARPNTQSYYVGGGGGGGQRLGSGNCPAGYKPDGKGGCQLEGMAPYIPGDIGRPDTGWTPVWGLYGAGVSPLPVQRVQRVCPPGFVIGKDGVCYEHLARTQRAHNPGHKPLLTGGEMNAIGIAHRARGRVAKTARRIGAVKPCSCKTKSRKR